MIKIKLSKSQKREIKKLHWEWFEKRAECKLRNTNETYKDFILKTLGINEYELKEIIIGEKSKIDSFVSQIKEIDKNDRRYEKLLTAFGYDNFCNTTSKEWNAYILCQKIGVDVCPYCNRQYIFTVKNSGCNITRPEIDHFYPKSKYPYLSCSLYNFILSCHICNHIKRDAAVSIIYPYEEEFGNDGKFKIRFADNNINFDVGFLTNPENIEVDIKSKGKNKQKIEKSISTFHLKELYNAHKIELYDLLQRYRNYSKPKIRDILKMLLLVDIEVQDTISSDVRKKILDDSIKLYVKAIKNMILGLPLSAENKQYPLRKFKEDIYRTVGFRIGTQKYSFCFCRKSSIRTASRNTCASCSPLRPTSFSAASSRPSAS